MELFTRFSEGGAEGRQSSPTDYESGGGGGSLTGRSTTKILKTPSPHPCYLGDKYDRPLGVNKTRWGRRGDLKESAYCNFRSLL